MNETSPLTDELVQALGQGQVLTQLEDILPYGYDGTAAIRSRPLAVVLPRNAEEVSSVLKIANRHKTPVVARGSGSGLSGGSIPAPDSLVLCLAQMNRVEELDVENHTLLAQAGVTTQSVYDAAEKDGLFYPPDPGSMSVSTVGGNVAENSGGLRGLKYGVTRDYVMGMEVVLADGSICWLGSKCVKDVAGYSLRDLFIGSEGTLGIVTRVLLKLLPKPAAQQTLLAAFEKMDVAAETVSAIIAAKIIPCTMEFLDKTTIQCVEQFTHAGLPLDCEALLLIETDGHPGAVADEADRIEQICRDHNAMSVRRAKDAQEGVKLAEARRSAFSSLARMRPTTILEDVTVPRSRLAEMIRAVKTVAEKHNLNIATFGHFGDGNLHPTILTDERNKEEMERVELALSDIVDAALSLNGTITGEHGVGLAKKRFLPREMSEASLKLLRMVKQTLDPENRLNPGKIFDL